MHASQYNHSFNGDAEDCVTWLSNTCEKHGKGDDLYAYINWAGLHRQKEEYKDKRKGTEGREGRG
jgi:hypothetical protein